MYLLLIFLPLIGSVCAGIFGRKLGPLGASYITVSCLLFTFCIALFAFYEVSLFNCCVYIKLVPWINAEMLNVDWGFLFDSLKTSSFFFYSELPGFGWDTIWEEFLAFIVWLLKTFYPELF